jgi:hypothetical protein
MLDTFFGLPTHALVVHAVVVLLPLTATGAVLIALVPRWRAPYGWLVLGGAVVSMILVPVATHSGQALYDRLSRGFGPRQAREAALMEHHRQLGHQLWPWVLVLLVGVAAVMVLHRMASRPVAAHAVAVRAGAAGSTGGGTEPGSAEGTPDRSARGGMAERWIRPAGYAAIALTLIGSLGTGVMVARIGHAGSKAVWSGVTGAR